MMQQQTPKLTFDPNKDYEVTLQYDVCKEGEGQYGVWHRYAVMYGGDDYALFATDYLHDKLKPYGKGDKLSIMKVQNADDKIQWDVIPIDGTNNKPDAFVDEITTSKVVEQPPTREYWHDKDDLTQYRIMKGQSWNLAVQSLEPYPTKAKSWEKGFGEIVKRQGQILVAMTDIFSQAKAHLESATAIPHLNNIWRKYEPKWNRELSDNEVIQLMGVAAEVKKVLVAELEPEPEYTTDSADAPDPAPDVEVKETTTNDADELPF